MSHISSGPSTRQDADIIVKREPGEAGGYKILKNRFGDVGGTGTADGLMIDLALLTKKLKRPVILWVEVE